MLSTHLLACSTGSMNRDQYHSLLRGCPLVDRLSERCGSSQDPSVETREAFFVSGTIVDCNRWISSVWYSSCMCVCVCVCVLRAWVWCRRASFRASFSAEMQYCSRNGFHTWGSRRIYDVLKCCDSCAIWIRSIIMYTMVLRQ